MTRSTSSPAKAAPAVQPLRSGERLTRAEFERRYQAMPGVKKAELIEGVVSMSAAVRVRRHGRPHAHLITWLGTYEAGTPGVEVADNSTVRLDLENEPQPDALLYIDPERGGQARISLDDYLEAAPELAAEVAAGSPGFDLRQKLEIYRRNRVREYIVWRVPERALDWFVLRNDRFERLAPQDGIHRSEVFPGLWLDMQALLNGDLAGVLATLQQGLTTPQHAEFVERLNPTGDRTD